MTAWLEVALPWRGLDRRGEPLELSRAEVSDAAAWVDHLARITRETPWMLQCEEDPLPSLLEQRENILGYRAYPGSLAIVARRPGERGILGTITLAAGRSRRTQHAAELSMGVAESAWGRGIGSLLMGAALGEAVQVGVVRRVSLSVFAGNSVAQRLYERVGFIVEGNLRSYVRWGRHVEDLVVMGLSLEGKTA